MSEPTRRSQSDDGAPDRPSSARPKRRSQADEVPAWALTSGPAADPERRGDRGQSEGLHGAPAALDGLGPGAPLDAGVAARMGAALGDDFSQVRVHEGPQAAAVSSSLGARAFTYGHHVGFGSGEYRPGTLVGDAILAHELAHVQQQQSAGPDVAAARDGGHSLAGTDLGNEPAFEHDADRAAVGALGRLWGIASQVSNGLLQASGRLQATRPRLRRCVGPQTETKSPMQGPQTGPTTGPTTQQTGPTTQPRPAASCPVRTPDEWQAAVDAANKLSGDDRATALAKVVDEALCAVGLTARKAGSTKTDQVDPADYAQAPVVNFDILLHQKKKWAKTKGEAPAPPNQNPGYSFSRGAEWYSVIGPNALKQPPFSIRQYAEHEIHHTRDKSTDEGAAVELPMWTDDFTRYFHQYFALPITNRPTWSPLVVKYYSEASEGVRKATITRLVEYFNNPPVAPADVDTFRKRFRQWLKNWKDNWAERQGTGTFVEDLEKALPAEPKKP